MDAKFPPISSAPQIYMSDETFRCSNLSRLCLLVLINRIKDICLVKFPFMLNHRESNQQAILFSMVAFTVR